MPESSIIIPVYNEEALLQSAVVDLLDRLREAPWSFEIILAENGSTDATPAIARSLAQRFAEVRTFSIGEANYGRALREGIAQAQGAYVLCDEIDLCDVDFHLRAVALLTQGEADFVVGSKRMPGAQDRRPWFRRVGTRVINGLLRVSLGFRGTDTHGLKAFRRSDVAPIARECIIDRDLFASELVIRATRASVRMTEIPVRVLEKRPPSVHLLRRVPHVLKGLGRLTIAIRLGR